jgi:hypothetical protein
LVAPVQPPQPIQPPQPQPSKTWEREEDEEIYRLLGDPSHTWDYASAVEVHNATFHKKRTETSYKQRVKKIAQEKGIPLRTNNRWTEEEKRTVLEMVQSHPINTPWEKLSEQLQRSEIAVKSIYYDHVSPMEHVQNCLRTIQTSVIQEVMDAISYKCVECGRRDCSLPYLWKSDTYCETCHVRLYKTLIEERWRQINEFSMRTNKASCNLCEKKAVFDNGLFSRFHYDHIDMFNKSESICEMVRSGCPVEDIYHEIDKCQLLCVSCHKLITKMEHLCGFVRLKKQMEDTEQDREACSAVYQTLMRKIYDALKSHALPSPSPASSGDDYKEE